jgi:hypothetical protein
VHCRRVHDNNAIAPPITTSVWTGQPTTITLFHIWINQHTMTWMSF